MTTKTKVALKADVTTEFPTNAAGSITASVIRAFFNNQIDSFLPTISTITASTSLVAGLNRMTHVDPSGGVIALTLPNPELAVNIGEEFYIKRTENGGNNVTVAPLAGDTIQGVTTNFGLSFENDSITVYSDGTSDWKIKSRSLFSIATLTATSASFGVTTSPVKFNGWDTLVFDTPNKVEGDLGNNRIEIVEFQGPQDGYAVNVTFNCEYTNNSVVTMQLFVGGALVGLPVAVNALGSGKPMSLTYVTQIGVVSTTSVELHIMAETPGTITNINAELQVKRIGR